MSGLFGRPGPSLKPDYTGLQVQTSVATLPIPIAYGQCKLAPNVIFYDNFRMYQVKSGGKGGLFSTPASGGYNYTADIIMALCEGPISNIGKVWIDQSVYTIGSAPALGVLALTLFEGTTPQPVWSYLAGAYPSQALAYQGTAYACGANYQLGSSANVGNTNFEVIGVLAGTGANGVDADPAQVIYDFLTNAQYGVGFDAASIDMTTLYGSSGDASLQTYCKAMGICFSPLLSSPEQASSILTRWLQLTNCGAVWSGGQLKFIPYGDVAIPSGNVTKTINTAIPIPTQDYNGNYLVPGVVVSPPANFVSDGGVVYTVTGAALTYIGATNPTAVGEYGVSPAGTYLFNAFDRGAAVTITATVNSPTSFTPNLTAAYSLTDLDFIDASGNKDPVQAQRLDPFSLPTILRIQCQSRDNQYGATPVEARDQSQIELYGARVGSAVQANEICDEINVAPIVVQTLLQRGLYVRTHFTFRLSWEYCLLDPMDIVEITDANLGLSAYPVRITAVEEDAKGVLTITAEELVVGVSTPGANPSSGVVSFQPNQAAGATAVNTPLIYEPPPALTGNIAQVWVGASGAAGSNWGGAYVWASVDNSTYSQIGTITAPLRQGLLTASLASASGWDTADALSVTLAESGGALTGTSAASAQAGATLSLVDGELLAYETATLTGTNAYSLTGLQRGFAGTAPAAHASNAPFARLDSAVVQYNLPQTWIGIPLYFKFQSFNAFGAGLEDLSTCTAYSYTPSGAGTIGQATLALEIGTNLDYGSVTAPASDEEDWGAGVAATPTIFIDLGHIAG